MGVTLGWVALAVAALGIAPRRSAKGRLLPIRSE